MTPDPENRDLRGLLVRGVGWVLASQGSTQLLALLTSVTIAHFLSPHDVGLATEAIVFVTLALVVGDFGFAAVIVQRPTITQVDMSTAFWGGQALGLALTLAGVGLSWPIAALYGSPRVQGLFAVLSLTFVVTAPGIVPGAVLTRELKFRSLEIRTMIAMSCGAATGIVLAIVGFGPWAIVAQSLTIATVSSVLLWRSSPWRPSATFSLQSLRAMSGFTGHVFGTRLLSWANLNVDNFLVGRFVGAAELGAYSIAFSIAINPVTRFALPVSDAFFPAFSRLRDPRRVGEIWLRAARMVALVVVPAMLGLVAVAPDLVNVVFGHRWHAAAPVLRLFAPIGLMQALTVLNNAVLQSLDRARLLFRISAVISVGSVIAYASGLPWGIKGVALALLIVSLALQPLFLWVTLRTIGLSLREWVASVGGVLQAGVGMLLVLLGLTWLLHGVQPALRLLILILAGATVYCVLVLWRAPEVIPELRRLARRAAAAEAVPTEPRHSAA